MSPVAVRPGKGSLSEPTAATQPWPRADQPHASARSSSERREYLLRHALELAFLVVSGNPEQDSRRSGLDVPLQTLNALRGRTISPSLRQAAKSGGTSIGVI